MDKIFRNKYTSNLATLVKEGNGIYVLRFANGGKEHEYSEQELHDIWIPVVGKYYIHTCTGQKVQVMNSDNKIAQIRGKDWKVTYTECTLWNLVKYYMPITKAEYDSSITLPELLLTTRTSDAPIDKVKVNSEEKSYCVNVNTGIKARIDTIDNEGRVWLTEMGTNHEKVIDKDKFALEWLGITEEQFWNSDFTISKMMSKGFVVPKDDKVNHPSHYTWLKGVCGIEVIDITRHLDFDIGNAVKYLLRAGHKSEEGMTDKEKTIQDLKKAIWYINDKIIMLQKHNYESRNQGRYHIQK